MKSAVFVGSIVLGVLVTPGNAGEHASPRLMATIDGIEGVEDFLVEIQPETAIAREIGTVGFGITGLEFDRGTGNLFALDYFDHLVTVDPDTAAVVRVSNLPPACWRGLTRDPVTNELFAMDQRISFDALYRIHPDSGTPTLVSTLSVFTTIVDLAFDTNSGTLYGANSTGGMTDTLVAIDPTTGLTTVVANLGRQVRSLAFDPSSGLLYSVDETTTELFTIDPMTGETASIGFTGFADIASLVVIVPAPGCGWILGAMALGGGVRRSRRER